MLRIAAIFSGVVMAFSQMSFAEYIVSFSQVGPNVVAIGSGSIDTAGTSYFGVFGTTLGLNASSAFVAPGTDQGNESLYTTQLSGPTEIGPGGYTFTSAATGDPTVINGSSNYLCVPSGYVSGSPLSGTMTFDNTTISGLGLTPGTYTWTWGAGSTADSFVVTVPSVPEPASLSLMALGAAALLPRRRAV